MFVTTLGNNTAVYSFAGMQKKFRLNAPTKALMDIYVDSNTSRFPKLAVPENTLGRITGFGKVGPYITFENGYTIEADANEVLAPIANPTRTFNHKYSPVFSFEAMKEAGVI